MIDQDTGLARERIDGGFSFALATFAAGLGLIAVLERVGVPDHALRLGVGVMIFSGFVIIAALLRTMRPVDFYAGGRGLPAPYVGLAYAALAAGLFLPFLPPLPDGIGLKSLAAGFGAGLIGAMALTGPYLRGAAAASIADLVGSRFPHPLARWAIAAIAAACAICVMLGAYEIALRALVEAIGVGRAFGATALGVLLVCIIVPGGLSGAIWLIIGGAVVTLAALGLPALLMVREATPWITALTRFHVLTGSQPNLPLAPSIAAALALGLCALAPLFGPAVASRDRMSALRSAPFACMIMAIIAGLAAMTMARSSLAVDAAFSGHASAGYLLESLPLLRKTGPTLAGLAGVFAVVLGSGVAAAGAQSFLTSVGHDAFHPKRRRFGPASRRLAYARVLAILIIALCGGVLATRDADPRFFITLALAISAILMAPLLALTLVKRTTSIDALAALLVATLVMFAFVATHPVRWAPRELAGNVIFAAIDAFLAGVFVSLLHGRGSLTERPALPKDEPSGPD